MIRLSSTGIRLCDGISRRELLRAGACGCLGLGLPELLRLQASARASSSAPSADACIVIFLWGAPSQFETLDPKPAAPSGIRGEFGVIKTALPGTIFGEHIPLLARRADQIAVVRTCAQTSTHHQSAGYEALTGHPPTKDAVALTATAGDDPHFGSVVSRLAPTTRNPLRFVTAPQLISDVGNLTPGQFAGYLGRQYDPFAVTADPSTADFSVDELSPRRDTPISRMEGRKGLLEAVDGQRRALDHWADTRALDAYQEKAFQLITSPVVRRAFDLSREPQSIRDVYGRNSFGQSCLLARRLVESGVKLVTVYSGFGGKTPQDAWDTHEDNFRKLKKMCPPMDQGTSALLDDLRQRGLTERTLLLWMGEFGRTPKINAKAGRDHWSNCYSIFLAGGGVQAGQCYGQSDGRGAYPVNGRVFSPGDITATVFHCLGINPTTELPDALGRPRRITYGEPMVEVLR